MQVLMGQWWEVAILGGTERKLSAANAANHPSLAVGQQSHSLTDANRLSKG